MGMRPNKHIPDKNYEHDCGHEFYYHREEREGLPNAVKPRKSSGMRRFVILFFDLILVIGGVTVIRSCLVGKEKQSNQPVSSAKNAVYRDYSAQTTIEKSKAGREYRLTLRRRDRALFSVDTNRIKVDIRLSFKEGGKTLHARTLAADEKLISHQFFLSVPDDQNPPDRAVFLWRVSSNRMIRITNAP